MQFVHSLNKRFASTDYVKTSLWTLGVCTVVTRPIRPLDLEVCSKGGKKAPNHEIKQVITGYENARKELTGTDRTDVGEHGVHMGGGPGQVSELKPRE